MLPFPASLRRASLALALVAFPVVGHAQMTDDTLRVLTRSLPEGRGMPDQGTASPRVYGLWPFYDSLTMPDLKGEVEPLLAVRWRNIDPETWQFSLRPNVKFSNGEALTAEGIVAFLDYLTHDGKGSTSGTNMVNQARVASARAIDPLTVEIKTRGPNPVLPAAISGTWFPAPKAWMDGPKEFANKPVGTGSYRVTNWAGEEIDYEAFAGSWRPAKIKRMKVLALPERPTRVQALITDQADIAIGLSIDNIDEVKKAGHIIDASPRPSIMAWQVFATSRKSPFNDVRVRQAANMAIDREALNEGLLRGLSRPATQCGAHFVFGYNAAIKPYSYDPARAKQLLREAGYPDGFDSVFEVVPGGQTGDTEIYQAVAQQLSAVGIRVKLDAVTFGDYLKKWLPPKDATTLGFVGDGFQSFCNSNNVDGLDAFSTVSCLKTPSFYCDEEEMELIRAAEKEFDSEKRQKMLRDLMALNRENAASILMVEVIDVTGVNRRIKGLQNIIQRYNYHEVSIIK